MKIHVELIPPRDPDETVRTFSLWGEDEGGWVARDDRGAVIPGTHGDCWLDSLTAVRDRFPNAIHLATVMGVDEAVRL